MGRCAASESFDGDRYYSYATVIAERVTLRGKVAYVLNRTQYSVTTSGHQNGVRQAIPDGETVFEVSGIGRGARTLFNNAKQCGNLVFDYSVNAAAEHEGKSKRARTEYSKDFHAGMSRRMLKQAAAASEFFRLRRKVDAATVSRLEKRAEAERKRLAKHDREEQARVEREHAEAIADWLKGESVSFPFSVTRVYLRAIDSNMETSRGARIPLVDAERAYRFATKARAKGWHRNGDRFPVGGYELDAVNDSGVVAGCHRVSWDEIDRFAATQGWAAL